MDSIDEDLSTEEYDPLGRVEAELGLDRLRGRTEALMAAASRLQGEADYAANTPGTRQESVNRLRPQSDDSAPVARGLGSPQMHDALQNLASVATRLVTEIDRVSEVADRHADALKGTDLGYEVREALTAVRSFAADMKTICAAPERYEPFGSDEMRRLSDEIAAALNTLGSDYAEDAQRRRRLRRGR